MEEWKEYRLGDIIKISSGFAYKGEYLGYGDKYLLGMGCVSFNEQFLDKGVRPYSGECDNRFYAKAGDIVLATRQQSDNMPILGMPAVIPYKYKDRKLIVGANLYRIINESKDFGNDFIYWLLKDPRYVNYIKSCQSGTTVRMITKANIENYTFVCPNKKSRLLISRFLWTLEKKIELNRRINENLEQQAQALFKSWFVDFEPFKDGKFVDSELGRIPEGWNADNIYEYIDVIYGAPYKSSLFNTDKNGYPLIRIRDLRTFNPQFYTSEILPNTEYIYPGDVVAGMDAEFIPTLWLGEKGILNQRCCKFVPKRKNISNYYILYLLMPELLYVQNYKTGTTVSHLGKADIDRIKVITPPIEIIEKFSTMVNPLFSKKIKTACENRILIQLRDTLLPRLMSGELAITDVNSRILRNK